MKLKSRLGKYLTLAFLLCIQSVIAADDSTDSKMADPAIQAIEALTTHDTASENTDAQLSVDTESGQTDMSGNNGTVESGLFTDDIQEDVMGTAGDGPQTIAKDVILVLDNSGSMKKNDPQFLASQAVNEFINNLDVESRVGIIIFDHSVRMAMPLTVVSDDTRSEILKSLDQINYKGQYTDSPAAIERAIYELKNTDRDDARKIIIFMTDGIVDTGNADKDLEKAKWLRQDLAADAADAEIQIFGIAFTEEADFQLIQSLSQQTEGEYYRALKPEALKDVFNQVNEIINRIPEPEPVVVPEPVTPPEPAVVAPPPQPVIIEVPVQTPQVDEGEEFRSKIILIVLTVLILAVIIMVLLLIKSSRKKDGDDDYAQPAFLNDINNFTSQATYKLDTKPTMLGRVAGTDTEHLNYIVVPQSTVGRRHALIEYKEFAYWIIDQGSINGTFVNDKIISGETRLKHGDRVRLHKYEFEFVMPEMVDDGMTVISNTVLVNNPELQKEKQEPAEAISSAEDEDMDLPEPDFDISTPGLTGQKSSLEDTVLRGSSPKKDTDQEPADETIMLDSTTDTGSSIVEDATLRPDKDLEEDDEDVDEDDEDEQDLTLDDGFREDNK